MFDEGLEKFRDKHKGKRAFAVLGGPSLKETDCSKLDNEIVFGANRVYLKDDLKLKYLFVGDKQTALQFKDDFQNVKLKRYGSVFTSKGIYEQVFQHKNHHYWVGFGDKKFHKDVTNRIFGGRSISFVIMQFAYFMGITKLYFIGMNHSWNSEGMVKNGREIITVGKDPNHFTDDYYGEGIKWFEPQLKEMETYFLKARLAYEDDGRELYNASLETELSAEILPRIDYNSLFEG